MSVPYAFLKQRQGLPLELKVLLSISRIREFVNHWRAVGTYVSFSGGKDSTVLLDLVRTEFPKIPAVFFDTGLEYPEIRDFVKTIDNVEWIKPKMHFTDVIKEYGYPVISKKTSQLVSNLRNCEKDSVCWKAGYEGISSKGYKMKKWVLAKKWRYLLDAPFEISNKCCKIMKINPSTEYIRTTRRKPIVGIMTDESRTRNDTYLKTGCNSFEGRNVRSWPMAFWTEEDVWEYIKTRNLPYSKIYDMGLKRTGCMFCMFGIQFDETPNRFQSMKKTHPKQYDYCINKLGCGKVLDYLNIDY